jgi:uroporphyrin-III C-methyltransferase
VKAARLLAGADVVVHDALADRSLLDLAPPGAERIDVGKRPGAPVPQERINALLVRLAGEHHCVVRLKGGDPFVFGRGGEEAQALAVAGVHFEVVPGVSSAFAAPAAAGVPVTHRGTSAAVTVVTGHRRTGQEQATDWHALARVGGTIVVLMGVGQRAHIAAQLMAGGLDPATPVMAVRWGTRPEQVVVRTTLGVLAVTAIEPPSTIVIGPVAALDLTSVPQALEGR